jgi:hypothetical protein
MQQYWGSLNRIYCNDVLSSWNVMAHGDAREGKWSGNWRMECVASTLHTTSEHGVSSITTTDSHTSAVSSRLNWRPCRFKWTRPFRRKTKSGSCACAITFRMHSTTWKANSSHIEGWAYYLLANTALLKTTLSALAYWEAVRYHHDSAENARHCQNRKSNIFIFFVCPRWLANLLDIRNSNPYFQRYFAFLLALKVQNSMISFSDKGCAWSSHLLLRVYWFLYILCRMKVHILCVLREGWREHLT